MIRLIYFIPIWTIYTLVSAAFWILGWPLVAFAAACGAYTFIIDPKKQAKGENPIVYHFIWCFMFPWDNWEDGIANDMYWKAPNMWLQIMYWSCLRNPANNMRLLPGLSTKVQATKIRYRGSFGNYGVPTNASLLLKYDTKVPQWFLCWQGLYSNFYYQFKVGQKLYRFWIGNAKLYPTDVFGGPYGYRANGTAGVLQFKRVK